MSIDMARLDKFLVATRVGAFVILFTGVRLSVIRHVGGRHGLIVAIGPIAGERLDVCMSHDMLLEVTMLQKALRTTRPRADVLFGVLVDRSLMVGERSLQSERPSAARIVALERLLARMRKHVRLESRFLTKKRNVM